MLLTREPDRPGSPNHSQVSTKPAEAVVDNVEEHAETTESTTAEHALAQDQPAPVSNERDPRFWLIMLTLSFAVLLGSLEGTVVVTSLPTIVEKLSLGKNYIWVANVYFLASTAVQPLFGQLCNLFGRKNVMIFIFGAYTLGSGICGGASSGTMLIIGRAVQGLGSGGLAMGPEVIIADMVPLRKRGMYMAAFLTYSMIGNALGPFIGGILVEKSSWRWVFYLNLPIGGLGMVVSYFFLNLKYDRSQSVWAKLKRVDYLGNAIVIAASTSILVALTWGGAEYPWSHARVVAPLVLGLVGVVVFVAYEGSGIPTEPVMPLRLFANRTAQIIYGNTLLVSMVTFWAMYFIPIYFQSVQLSSPSRSGVQILPIILIAIPGAAVASFCLAKFGKYKAMHITGWLLMTVGVGLMHLLDKDTPTAGWVLLQALPAAGAGMLITTFLPAFQAASPEFDQAAATGSWSFMRWFGNIWGVAVGGAVFNSFVQRYAHGIDDPVVRELLAGGDAYASATRAFVTSFEEPLRGQIIAVFEKAMKKVLVLEVPFAALGLIVACFEKDIPLRTELATDYGLEERKKASAQEKA